jgi:hypothetical protein
LKQLKEFSNTLCREKELSTINFDKKAEKNITTGEYRLLMKGQDSWKEDLREAIDYTKARVDSIEEMKKFLKENFNVEMKIQNKNLKFKHPEKEEFCKGGRLGANYEKETIVNGIQHKILEEARHEKSLVSRKLELYNALERRTIYLEERTDEKGKPEVRASLDVNPFDLPKESKQFRSYPSFEEAIFYLIGEKGYRAVKEETVKINRLGEEERTTQKIEAEFNKKYFKKHEEKEKKQERDRGLSR